MRFYFRIITILLVIPYFFTVSPRNVVAFGVRVFPASIEATTEKGKETTMKLRVENPGRDVALFDVYADDFERVFHITPASFTLESGEKRDVAIRMAGEREGILQTNISVVSSSLAGKPFNIGSGIKIPVLVTVGTGGFFTLTAGIIFLDIACALVLLFIVRRAARRRFPREAVI